MIGKCGIIGCGVVPGVRVASRVAYRGIQGGSGESNANKHGTSDGSFCNISGLGAVGLGLIHTLLCPGTFCRVTSSLLDTCGRKCLCTTTNE